MIIVEEDDPTMPVTELGEADNAKEPTIRLIVVVRVMTPSVPVIVRVYCPEAVPLPTERPRLEEMEALKFTIT